MNTRLVRLYASLLVLAACGGGDGGTPPGPTVSAVVITSPGAPPTLASIGATSQFAAQPRDASGNPVAGAGVTWSSSNTGVATVSGGGLVTAVANGTTNITATSGTVQSAAVVVTVAQVAAAVVPTPVALNFGAIGTARQLTAAVNDAGGSPVAGAAAVTWSRSGPAARVSVTAGGLVTSTVVGTNDTVIATSGTLTARIPVTVTQLTHNIVLTSTQVPPDTLFTTNRTRQYSAVARDSNNNNLGAQPAFTWTSSLGAVASVSGAGLVTALGDGTSNIQAAVNTVTASRPIVVRRFPATFSIAPPSVTIATNAGTQLFTGTSQDSIGTNLPIAWSSLNTNVATVQPGAGATTTATARGNGTTSIVMTTNGQTTSASFTASNQVTPISFANDVQPIFTANCTSRGCHIPANLTGSLNLSVGAARGQLVGIASAGSPGQTRVIAGDSTNSYLIKKLKGAGTGLVGNQMPDGFPPLAAGTITIIARWIQEGANNN